MTDAPKHTPVPWRVKQESPKVVIIRDTRGVGICSLLSQRRRSLTRTLADARRIIACVTACEGINPEAVPDLLAACERALSWLSSYPGEGALAAYDDCRAAIAAAKGGTP